MIHGFGRRIYSTEISNAFQSTIRLNLKQNTANSKFASIGVNLRIQLTVERYKNWFANQRGFNFVERSSSFSPHDQTTFFLVNVVKGRAIVANPLINLRK